MRDCIVGESVGEILAIEELAFSNFVRDWVTYNRGVCISKWNKYTLYSNRPFCNYRASRYKASCASTWVLYTRAHDASVTLVINEISSNIYPNYSIYIRGIQIWLYIKSYIPSFSGFHHYLWVGERLTYHFGMMISNSFTKATLRS